jgi:uncharacterized protein YjbI with pentapeptide repeats
VQVSSNKRLENSMPTEEGRLTRAAKVFSIPALLVALLAFSVSYSAYRLQKRVADRVWLFQLITTIYESESCPTGIRCAPKAGLRSRKEAIRAYAALRQEYGKRVDLTGAFLSFMVFSSKEDKDFPMSDFSGATMLDTNFSGINLSGCLFRGGDLVRAVMPKADLHGSDFTSANLQGANLAYANLEGAKLGKAILGVCGEQQFDAATGETYKTADLTGANLRGATLDGASLCGVSLAGADLTDVKNLSQQQINLAEGDKDTKVPNYLSRPTNWDH